MGKLFRAFRAEQRKLLSKNGVIVCIVLVFLLTFATSFALNYMKSGSGDTGLVTDVFNCVHADLFFAEKNGAGWHAQAEETVKQEGLRIEYDAVALAEASGPRRAVLSRDMQQAIRNKTVAQFRLDNELPIYDWSDQYALILCLWMMTPVVAVIAVLYASDSFAGEFARGTIRVIISRPATRLKLYIAKLMSAFLFGTILLGAAYLAASIGCGVLFSSTEGVYVGFSNGAAYSTGWGRHLFSVFVCCLAAVLTSIALCAAVGNISRSRAGSATAGALLAVCGMGSGRLIGLFGSSIAGLALPGCFDLTVPLCGVAYSSGNSVTACAISVAAHLMIMIIAGYLGLKKDI